MARRGQGFSDPEGSVSFSVSAACRFEIEAAIDALVIDENLVAAHLLASAAHDVMSGHARRVGAAPRLDMASILKPLFPGHEKTLADYLLRPYNAMKTLARQRDRGDRPPIMGRGDGVSGDPAVRGVV